MDIESPSDDTSDDDTSDDAAQCCAKRRRKNNNYIYSGGNLTREEKLKVANLQVADHITEIPNRAFYSCMYLTTVDVSSSSTLSKIQASAFEECSSLISIMLPNSLEVIEERAFRCCNRLLTFSFLNNSKCKKIQNQAFLGCNSLTSINLPDSIEILGENVRFILSFSFFFFVSLLLVTIVQNVKDGFTHFAFRILHFCCGKKYISRHFTIVKSYERSNYLIR